MRSTGPSLVWVAAIVAFSGLGACKHYVSARSYSVEPAHDARSAHDAVERALAQNHYAAPYEDPSGLVFNVRAHADESDAAHPSFMRIDIGADGRVTLTAHGALVRPDGSVHSRLSNEMTKLERAIHAAMRAEPSGPAEGAAAEQGAPPAQGTPSPANASPAHAEPPPGRAWTEGDFTCVPYKLPADGRQLRIRLSNDEYADVAISVAYQPGLCRAHCPVPEGCPALGLGDSAQIDRLAARLSRREVDGQASLVLDGRPVSLLDLPSHGSIKQALHPSK